MNYFRTHGRVATGNITIEAAWEICQNHPEIRKDFEENAKAYQWDGIGFSAEDPYWAYWFARHVIRDEWLPGEDVILKDQKVWRDYVQYTESLKALGCIGHTLRENPDFVVDRFDVIKGWRPGHGPVIGVGKMAKRTTLVERFGTGGDAAAVADRIAEYMRELKANRELRHSQLGDDDED